MNKVIHTKMDHSSFLMLFYLLLMSAFVLYIVRTYFKCEKDLPPGPRPWPIIGNLHQVGKNPHVSTAIMAQKHGPLISLRLGTQILVVASSPEAAIGILKIQDRFLSSRFIPNAFESYLLPFTLIWSAECDENWKSLRTLCKTHMFSTKALESQSSLREKKIGEMLDFLCSKKDEVVNVEEVVFTTTFNTISNIFFGRDLFDLRDENGGKSGLKEKLLETLANGVAPNVSDFFPRLKRWDLQGLRKANTKQIKEIYSSWEDIINDRRLMVAVKEEEQCFLDRLLENGFSNDQINTLTLELFTAGTDTTTATIVWAMAELIKNKKVMCKLQEDIRNEIHYPIVEFRLSKLSFLNSCIKETLRLHPPAPFLLPHRAIQTCEVMNHTIPHGAQVLINIWAIGRDPKHWEDPLLFKPERFLNSELDFKGQDFVLLPFGAGRRMCPGLSFGINSVQSVLANLILRYDWILPNDEDSLKIDMKEKFGVTLHKGKPLQLSFKHMK